jgi:hypothetical protein
LTYWAFHFYNFILIFFTIPTSIEFFFYIPHCFPYFIKLLFVFPLNSFMRLFLSFIDHSYNHYFEFFGIFLNTIIRFHYCWIIDVWKSFVSCFFILLVFLHWHLCVCGHITDWMFYMLCSFSWSICNVHAGLGSDGWAIVSHH